MECNVRGRCLTVDNFVDFYPEFEGMTKEQFFRSFRKSIAYVDPTCCPCGWTEDQHNLAVLSAIAHVFYKTPDGSNLTVENGYDESELSGMGNIMMATEGSVSIMRKTYTPKTATENDLISTAYGEVLLSLYEAIMPPLTDIQPSPYYPVGYSVRWY